MIRTYPHPIRKRPRRFHKFIPVLASMNECEECCDVCNTCMADLQEKVDNERPGHVWAYDDGKIVYLEDVVVEARLGRKLRENETVIHTNGNILDNRDANLEVVEIPDLGVQ